jgi:hypothetical protein
LLVSWLGSGATGQRRFADYLARDGIKAAVHAGFGHDLGAQVDF